MSDIAGVRTAKDPSNFALDIRPGDLEGQIRVLTVTAPEFDDYLGEWAIHYTAYVEPRPCPCCGQPRGAGSLHN